MIETAIYFLTIIGLAFFTGIVVKTADYLEDTKKDKNKIKLISIGTTYGLLIFLMAYYFPIIAPICLGTILGLILFGKIDKISHRVATTIAILLTLILLPQAINILLAFFVIVNIFEEVINDYFDKHKLKNKILHQLATSRPLLEISALAVSIFLWRWEIFIAMIFFDIAYLTVTKYENKKIKQKLNKKLNKK